jgi:hypothetical protein
MERAISLCREGLQKFPHHVSARVTLGWALLESGKLDEARQELELVLQRAPDNLAAIRGLAELHDRTEHTLNLPMDGPGQWPPDAASLAEAEASQVKLDDAKPAEAQAASTPAPVAAAAESKAPAVIVPAELGLAMWSPIGSQPQPATAVPSPAIAATEPAATPHPAAGMSSVRELDPTAGVFAVVAAAPVAVQPEPPAAPAAAPVALSSGAEVATVEESADVDIAALIAEAEKLEVAAEQMEPLLVLETGVDFDPPIEPTPAPVVELAINGAAVISTEPPQTPTPEPPETQPVVVALERFLRQVQARRDQVVTESVA